MTTQAQECVARFATTRDTYIAQCENEIVNTAADRLAKLRTAYWRGVDISGVWRLVIHRAYAELEQMGPLEPVEVRIERSSK